MDFQERLRQAVHRGLSRGVEQSEQQKAKRLTHEEIRGLYSKYRLELSEHIEQCLKHLPQHFPGFEVETVYGDRGWGAAVHRDDSVGGIRGRRTNLYSRLEIAVKPVTEHDVLDLQAKGTIRNRETFRRHHFQAISEVDLARFKTLVDQWILEFAELYAATGD